VKLSAPRTNSSKHGSTLMITLAITLLLGLILASYLTLAHTEHALTTRTQAWQNALALAEAGVEEALAQLNPGALATNVTTGNGWSLSDGLFRPDPPERTLLGGSYAVAYTPANPPTIYATGYTAIASASVTLSRAVCVTTTNAPLLARGLNVGQITNPSGYKYSEDSFDSENPSYSDDGRYNAAQAKTAEILNPPAIARAEFPDVLPPFPIGLPLPTKFNDTYVLSGDYFIPGDLVLMNYDKLYVGSNTTAVIYVIGNVNLGTSTEIEIAPTGTLKLYVAGSTASLDYINNHGTPHNFQYFGLPGNTNVALTQQTPAVVASIYAPEATFAITHDNSLFNFAGALNVKNLNLNRPFKFHFDESLARSGPKRGFVVASWREL